MSAADPDSRGHGSTDQEYVYMIGASGVSIVKIGRSTNIAKRLATIQRMSPTRLVLLWSHPGGHELETKLHRHFASRRLHGEWFDFGEEDPVRHVQEAVEAQPWLVPPREDQTVAEGEPSSDPEPEPVVRERTLVVFPYQEIAADLRQAIRAGDYAPGSPLPTQGELAEHYSVARATMSAALRMLAEEGLIRGIPGQGTFVLDPDPLRTVKVRYDAVTEPSRQGDVWEAACQQAGVTGQIVTIGVTSELVPNDLADVLEVFPGTELVQRVSHATIDNIPAQVHISCYPASRDEVTHTPSVAPATADDHVIARPASAEEASDLRLRLGAPVLEVNRLIRDPSGRPVEFVRVVSDPSRVQLAYDRLPPMWE